MCAKVDISVLFIDMCCFVVGICVVVVVLFSSYRELERSVKLNKVILVIQFLCCV